MESQILYIDDEEDNLIAFKSVFRRKYQINTVLSAAEALELLRTKSYKIIISDQRMPKMTGVQFFEQINDQYPRAIRMILTGYADMQSIMDAINKGHIFNYISKPWDSEALEMVLNKAIELYDLKTKNEELFKANVQARFEVLKNQINPHFLFNSMNILSALIPKQPEQAVRFTNLFSKLYRSLLELRDQQIISLNQELEFVHSYVELQKIRFADALKVEITIPETKKINLPPFSLQLLIENAIKHNIVSESNPLTIAIHQEEQAIVVSNNLSLRKNVADSTGTGLKNLKHRYELLNMNAPIIDSNDQHFTVKIETVAEF